MACITKKRGKLVIDFYDQHGKRRLKTLPDGTSKTKAKKVLREIENMVERAAYLPRAGIPTFKSVSEDWLKYKRHSVYICSEGSFVSICDRIKDKSQAE